ncbi:hypothetical protein JD488_06275 [Aeromonas jandaei]|uniref:hypothetical protein n=1 Tax=Aeromonas jandaei TaxID=650 RepID=UPI00191E1580|nr:hypothetical protein [Aeromonas jandaei]MBL0666301.1 hypothetical protein [Aeromonas jandaei]MBL0666311.1 hypothetical protein [Aeromonas jandaei]
MTLDDIEKYKRLKELSASLWEELPAMIASGAPKSDLMAKSKEYTAAYLAHENFICSFFEPYRDGR